MDPPLRTGLLTGGGLLVTVLVLQWGQVGTAAVVGGLAALLVLVSRLAGDVERLARRVRELEQREQGRATAAARAGAPAAAEATVPPGPAAAPQVQERPPTPAPARPFASWGAERPPARPRTGSARRPASTPPQQAAPIHRPPHRSAAERPPPLRRAWAFVTGGNPVARVGLLVLFVGVGLLLRYAVEQGVISVEVRLALAAAVGAVLVVLGHRLRSSTAGFGLTLQGGGVAVLYLTVYAAHARYALLGGTTTVLLMAGVAGLCTALALRQDVPGLGVLAVGGGLAAPVLAGSDDADPRGLLLYVTLLSAGVLLVAGVRAWRDVALVGLLGTLVLGVLWAVDSYRDDLYLPSQLALAACFAAYLLLGLRLATATAASRPPDERADRGRALDGTLVLGLPAAVLALQVALVDGRGTYAQAASCAVLAAVYLLGAALLRGRAPALLVAALAGVGLAAATLAVPYAVGGAATGTTWVVQGAGLVWLGARQRRGALVVAALGLQLVAVLVLAGQGVLLPLRDWSADSATGWLVALALAATAWLLRAGAGAGLPRGHPSPLLPGQRLVAQVWLLAALGWWAATALVHVVGLLPERTWSAGVLGAAAASAVLVVLAGRVLRWRALRLCALGLPAAAVLVATTDLLALGSPARDWRPLGWLAVGAVGVWLWSVVRRERGVRAGLLVVGGLTSTLVLAHAAGQETAAATQGSWALAAVGATLAAALLVSVRLPVVAAQGGAGALLLGLLALPVAAWVVLSWGSDGAADPLGRLPLLTPVDVVGVASLAVLLLAVRVHGRHAGSDVATAVLPALGLLAFGTFTATVLRAVAVVGDVPWNARALLGSSAAQAVLAVAWTLLALVVAVVATRRGDRLLWTAGAALLGLVVAKLFLVDLAQSEALVLVGAFLVVGALVLLIGYLAPLPPARRDATAHAEPVAE